MAGTMQPQIPTGPSLRAQSGYPTTPWTARRFCKGRTIFCVDGLQHPNLQEAVSEHLLELTVFFFKFPAFTSVFQLPTAKLPLPR